MCIMSFTGKYEVESQENYDTFMTAIGLPKDVIEKGRTFTFVTEVVQNGNEFTWSQIYPGHTMTNKFIIDQECEMETMAGKKFKATVHMDGGKVVVDFPKYHHSSEIVGNKLVETSVAGGITFKRISKKIA
ncbi:gastrotropin isoform X2 [Rhinatrema bivittatum]|uniref:gastrotropin isoform X2 n=1 Tax=Rhinatrema bivittatum TaxID=194408 RepID=UPI00112D3AA1|nr:gastrotropin isoform X2 [Rhinatrema bivittatum]